MTTGLTALSLSLADLRRDFDNSFAAPPQGQGEGRESLITLGVAGEPLAIRTSDITGVAKRRRIVPLPTDVPGLLGITALRGTLLPVYDLAILLGLPEQTGEGSWLVLAAPQTPLGLLFDEFQGQVEIERPCLYESDARAREHLRLMARIGELHRAVIDVPGIVEQIRKTAAVREPEKE